MVTENPPSQPIQLTTLGNYRLQQQYLVDRIKEVSDFSAIAFLYRNNSSVIPLMDMFDQHHIPFYMKDVEHRFFKHWIVEDVLNILRLSFDEKRIDIFEKIYLKLDAYLSKAQFEQLANSHNNESVFDCLLKGNILKDYQKKKITLYKKIITTINKTRKNF